MESSKNVKDTQFSKTLNLINDSKSRIGKFFCPKCKQLPQIVLRDDLIVEITCKDSCKSIPQICPVNKAQYKTLRELAEYQSYELPLFKFLEESSKDFNFKCPDHNVTLSNFCKKCAKNCCQFCITFHQNQNHPIVNSPLFEEPLKCQEKDCQPNIVEYFCQNCNKNLCKKCALVIHKQAKHSVLKWEDYLNETYIPFQQKIKDTSIEIIQEKKKLLTNKESLIKIEEKIREYINLIENKIETYDEILGFFSTITKTVFFLKDIPTNTIKSNMEKNDITKVFSAQKPKISKELYEVFNNINQSIISKTLLQRIYLRQTKVGACCLEKIDSYERACEYVNNEEDWNNLKQRFSDLLSLNHRNICPVEGMLNGKTSNDPGKVILELVGGKTVGELLDEKMSFSEEFKIELLLNIAEGVKYLHENDFVSGSIAPHNICLTGEYTGLQPFPIPKLCAFITTYKCNNTKVIPDFKRLSPENYSAPEVFNGKLIKPSDIYSFGLLIYSIFTGETPFSEYKGTKLSELRKLKKQGELLIPSIIEPKTSKLDAKLIIDLIKNCCEKDPNKRPTIKELIEDLTDLKNEA